jgi:hypothetical protein
MGATGPAGAQGLPGRDGKDAAAAKRGAWRFKVLRLPQSDEFAGAIDEVIATPIM